MKKHVLIVDDEKYILQMLTAAFKGSDYEIACASDGKQAFNYIKENFVDVVITDILMPKMSGYDLFYEIKKFDPFIQIIVITGYPSIKNIVGMFESGASDFIIKPFDIEKLKKVVDETFVKVERWHSLRLEWHEHTKRNDHMKG